VSATLGWAIGGLYGLLVTASLTAFALVRLKPGRNFRELIDRIKSWWVMITLFAAAMALGPVATLCFLGFVSFLALKEYLSLIPGRRADRRVLFWAYLAVPVQFYWIGIGWYGMFAIFIPVYMFLLLPARMILAGETKGFLRAAGTLHWGLMSTVYSVGHAAALVMLPGAERAATDGAELLFFLMFLTQFNDVAQYVSGKLLGRTPVVPTISPRKTWEGLIGGVVTTALTGWLIAPWFTPLEGWQLAVSGLLIAISGFVGDVTFSAVKRDLAIKDSGSLIPGHGGVLDRIDSLTFTAPLFFHFVRYFAF
jgi:phosphatidate cytidylyltransferase